jgi:DNA-directed RNA polymerase specialized sigma24 family protein
MSGADGIVGYYQIHRQVKDAKGPARAHACIDCGGTAAQWSYTHDDPNERQDPKVPYGTSIQYYVPRCVSCHKKFDVARSRGVVIDSEKRLIALEYLTRVRDDIARLAELRVSYIKTARRYSLTNQDIATALGVSESAVRALLKRHGDAE